MSVQQSHLSEKSRRQITELDAVLVDIQKTGKRFWLTDGTLLGFIRWHRYIDMEWIYSFPSSGIKSMVIHQDGAESDIGISRDDFPKRYTMKHIELTISNAC